MKREKRMRKEEGVNEGKRKKGRERRERMNQEQEGREEGRMNKGKREKRGERMNEG